MPARTPRATRAQAAPADLYTYRDGKPVPSSNGRINSCRASSAGSSSL